MLQTIKYKFIFKVIFFNIIFILLLIYLFEFLFTTYKATIFYQEKLIKNNRNIFNNITQRRLSYKVNNRNVF